MEKSKPIAYILKSSRWVWRNMNAKQTESYLTIFVSLAMRLIGLALLLFACLLIWRLTQNDDFSLDTFSVPKSLEESGYTGTYLALHVQDVLSELKKQSGSAKTDSLHVGNAAETDFNVSVMGLDLSIKNIAHQLRLLFGRPVKTIRGEMSQSGKHLYLNLRVSGFPPELLEAKVETDDPKQAIDALCKKAAEALLGKIDPYRLAIICYREKRYAESVDIVRKIIKERPHERTWAYIAWGSILEDQGNIDLAISKFQRATELDSTFALAWQRWGACLSNQKKYKEASEKYETSLLINPDKAGMWLFLSWSYLRSGEVDKCNVAVSNALRYAHGEPVIWLSCAEIKMNQDSAESAEKMILQSIDLAGETAYGYLGRSLLAVMKKDTPAIIQNGLYASELDPTNVYGPKMAMMAAIKNRNFTKAIEIGSNINIWMADKEAAIQIFNQMAMAYNLTGKRDSAFANIRRGITLDSTLGYPHATLGEVYAMNGDLNNFYKNLEKSFKLGMPVSAIDIKDEPYKSLATKPQYKALIQKYTLNPVKQ